MERTKKRKFIYANNPQLLSDEEKEFLQDAIKEYANADELISSYYHEFYAAALKEIDSINAQALDARYQDETDNEKALLESAEKRQQWLNDHLDAVVSFVNAFAVSEDDMENGGINSYEMDRYFFEMPLQIGRVLPADAEHIYDVLSEGADAETAAVTVFNQTYGEAYDKLKHGASSKNEEKKAENLSKKNRLDIYLATLKSYAVTVDNSMKDYKDALAHTLNPDTYGPITLSDMDKALVNNWLKNVPSKEFEQTMARIYSKLKNKKSFSDYAIQVNNNFKKDEVPYYVSKYYFVLCQDGVLKLEKEPVPAAFKPVSVEKIVGIEPTKKPVEEIVEEDVASVGDVTFTEKERKYLASIGLDTEEKINDFAKKTGGLATLKNSLGIVLRSRKDFEERFKTPKEPGEE